MPNMYAKFGASLLASTLAMYLLAFSQLASLDHLRPSLSVFYITLSMVAVMGLIMLTAMRSMLENRRLNIGLYAGFAVLLLTAFLLGRNAAGIGDSAFLRSMIPHHSRAILMCEQSQLKDAEVKTLCGKIVEAQRKEIDQMERFIREGK